MDTNDEIRVLGAFIYAKGLVHEDMPTADIRDKAADLKQCLDKLINDLMACSDDASDEELQAVYYEAGKLHFSKELRWWFSVLYHMLLGNTEGARLGYFTKIVSIHWVVEKIRTAVRDPWGMGLTPPITPSIL
jgi:lysyl-tRNA synthetase class I